MSAKVEPAFWTWLMCQKERDDPVGDLARDAAGDARKKFRRPQGSGEQGLVGFTSENTQEPARAYVDAFGLLRGLRRARRGCRAMARL